MSKAYSSLERSKSEIRVLRLEAGHGAEDIRGTLEIVPISQAPSYEALSYVWGDSEKPKTISLDRSPFPVTENLYTALIYLRSLESVRLLWIDAVCINQTDNAERLHQVQMMADIYKRASVVLIWLGAPMNESEAAIEAIQTIVDVRNNFMRNSSENLIRLPDFPTGRFDGLFAMLSSIIELLVRNYWYRIWVVQEAAISSSEPIVGCGYKWISWSDLSSGLLELKTHLRKLRETENWGIDSYERQLYKRFQSLRHNVFDMNTIRKSIQLGYLENPYYTSPGLASKTNILDLLWHTRLKQCSDPRDCVYSLLGLFRWVKSQSSVELTMNADYTSSLRFVYTEITRLTIELEGNLEILNMKDHASADFLPSWTPNFSSLIMECFPALSPSPLEPWLDQIACRHENPTFELKHTALNRSKSKRLDELVVVGKTFDSIHMVIDMSDFNEFPLRCIRKVHQACMKNFDLYMLARPPSKNEEVTEAIWRTLVADRSDGFGSPCRSSHGNLYKQILGGRMAPSRSMDSLREAFDAEPFLHDIRRALYHFRDGPRRQFVISQRGYFGLGPSDCAIGDLLCVFQNFSMPAVLRQTGDFYTYQGNAYVHGVMKGEEYPRDDTDLEEFVLR